MDDMSQYYMPYIPSSMSQYYAPSGIGPLTYRQACTLIKIIAWVCKHEDCDVTEDEAKELCTSIQYLSNTRPKEEVEE